MLSYGTVCSKFSTGFDAMKKGVEKVYRALLFSSLVLMRTTCSIGNTKIFPSPRVPVAALSTIMSMITSTSASSATISIFVLGSRSALTFWPPIVSRIPLCLPRPFTS